MIRRGPYGPSITSRSPMTDARIRSTSGAAAASPASTVTPSALDRPHGKAADEAVEEQIEHERDRDRDQDGRRLERLPEDDAADELGGDAGGDDLLGGGRDEGQGVDELAGRQGEGEHHHGHDPGEGH